MVVSFVLSAIFTFFFTVISAIDIDVNSSDSIKAAAKVFASGIVSSYNSQTDLIPGLFNEQNYFFWEDGEVWNALLEYSYLTGDSQFNDNITTALNFQVGDNDAYMPANQSKNLGNDDQSVWGLAALTAAEIGFPSKPAQGQWIDLAKNVFDSMAARWDASTCNGGLRWQIYQFNNGYNYKNSDSNGAFFLLAARLALATGNTTYSDWAQKTYDWSQSAGLVTTDFKVYDGAQTESNCSSVNRIQWSFPHGLYTEGAAAMYNLTKGDSKWKDAVSGFVNSSSDFQYGGISVLYDPACETTNKCSTDQSAFKGLAARSYARSAVYAPFTANSIHPVLQASAKGAAGGCNGTGSDLVCTLNWIVEDQATNSLADGGLSEVLSSMEVVQGLLYSNVKGLPSGNTTTTQNPSATQSGGTTASGTSTAPATKTGAATRLEGAWPVGLFAGLLATLGSL